MGQSMFFTNLILGHFAVLMCYYGWPFRSALDVDPVWNLASSAIGSCEALGITLILNWETWLSSKLRRDCPQRALSVTVCLQTQPQSNIQPPIFQIIHYTWMFVLQLCFSLSVQQACKLLFRLALLTPVLDRLPSLRGGSWMSQDNLSAVLRLQWRLGLSNHGFLCRRVATAICSLEMNEGKYTSTIEQEFWQFTSVATNSTVGFPPIHSYMWQVLRNTLK